MQLRLMENSWPREQEFPQGMHTARQTSNTATGKSKDGRLCSEAMAIGKRNPAIYLQIINVH